MKLIHKVHRRGGVALALFMTLWFASGLVMSVSSVVLGWRRLRRAFRHPEPWAD